MAEPKLLVYLMRRDLRVADNPIFNALSTTKNHGFTHLLPIYIFPAQQVEISGFIGSKEKSPYPEARSKVAGFWRCGPFRATFLAESVWDLKENLEKVGSGLCIRAGMVPDIINSVINNTKDLKVSAVWMLQEEGVEEKQEERGVKKVCASAGVDFKLWVDEKYLIDDRDLHGVESPQDLPDIFTTYRKMMEPLREAPRKVLPSISEGSLPTFPVDNIPPQTSPFSIPTTLESLITALKRPLKETPLIANPPAHPSGAKTVHPFLGGETNGHKRIEHLILSGAVSDYKSTRNGMMGDDFSSKLSAYLAIGCITARQVHAMMRDLEDGVAVIFQDAPGFGKGENEGTKAMRFELLWRDYMRLCTRKYGDKLFKLSGFKSKMDSDEKWSSPSRPNGNSKEELQEIIERFLNGTTGTGLIDASQRELYHTGYTSNRTRQNVASFLSKHLYIDWRIGAEWYESMLVDYDLSSNWGNWQYVAGVGNDPRDDQRVFNPVKQSLDYDPEAEYIKTWVPEARGCSPGQAFQLWTVPEALRAEKGLDGLVMVKRPLKRIQFTISRRRKPREEGGGGSDRGGRGGSRPYGNRGGRGRGGGGGGGGENDYPPLSQNQFSRGGGYGGRGYGSSRGHIRGYHTSRGGRATWNNHGSNGGGREARTGMMDKEREAAAGDNSFALGE